MGNHSATIEPPPEPEPLPRRHDDGRQEDSDRTVPAAHEEIAKSAGSDGSAKQSQSAPSIGPYTLGKKLGQGQYGIVHVGIHSETGCKVAIKQVSKQSLELDEIRLQRLLDHESVVKVHDVIECDEEVYMVMDCACGGDLFDYLVKHVRLKEDEARRLFQQIIDGVDHCHQRNVVHRDLKVENILLDKDKNIKITDFGFAAEMQEGELLTRSCGSPNYAAPELFYKDCKYRGPEIDVWSCGVILYALLTNNLPFDAENIQDLIRIIKKGRYSIPSHVSNDAKDLLTRMLCVGQEERISIADIRKHAWFTGGVAPETVLSKPEEACHVTESTPKTKSRAKDDILGPCTESPTPAKAVGKTLKVVASAVIKPQAVFKSNAVRYVMSCGTFGRSMEANPVRPMVAC